MPATFAHEMPFGATVLSDGGVRFRLWAPDAPAMRLVVDGEEHVMSDVGSGWLECRVATAGPGSRYQYLHPDGTLVPDPCSRFQPEDVMAPSEVIDAHAFAWQQGAWKGRPWHETVLYELHPGTFSAQGGYDGIARQLDHLAGLGVTAVELMPLADFPGSRGWGYDGVLMFAPDHAYGRPEDLKRLIDLAHGRGLMVFLDVVYNHFGPEGNFLHLYAPGFFTERFHTPWGAAIDYGRDVVRSFAVENALYWLTEYRFDGLRLDAVHAIRDDRRPDILEELASAVRTRIARDEPDRHVHLVLENDDNAAHYLARHTDTDMDATTRPHREPTGVPVIHHFNAQWNDDIHHICHHLMTGEETGYYADHADRPVTRLGRALTTGFDYQGEVSPFRAGRQRGEPSAHLPPTAFVGFLQNHDQVGNRALGERLDRLAPDAAIRALLTINLIAPHIPMLWMGEEWGSARPFLYFCAYDGSLAKAVRDGRRREFKSFDQFSDPETLKQIPDPNLPSTFEASRLDWEAVEAEPHASRLALVTRLLKLRAAEIMPRLGETTTADGAAEADDPARTLTARWRLADGSRLTLHARLGGTPATLPPLGEGARDLLCEPQDARTAPHAWAAAWSLYAA